MERRGIEVLNAMSRDDAQKELLRLCHSTRWAERVVRDMPFRSAAHALKSMDDNWASLSPADYLEAFSAHPRIGDRKAMAEKFAPKRSGWESEEQAGASGASELLLDELARRNDEYFDKFGFVFLICATGKSAEEMLRALESRFPHEKSTELAVAAEEQRKITHLRFERLLRSLGERTCSTSAGAKL